ncbi:MAG: hypothetical protein AB8B57_01450 [Congregibacter sp.]
MPRVYLLAFLLFSALFLCGAERASAAAEPYGKYFVLADADWPRERYVASAQAPGTGNTDNLEEALVALRGRAAEQESAGGPYAPALAETLGDLARLLEQSGKDVEAMALRERALHLLRINQGLYAPEQGPLLQAMLSSLRRNGDFESLDLRYAYFFRLHGSGRPPWTPVRWEATMEYLRWQREALRRGLGGDQSRRILDVLSLHEDLLESTSTDAGQEAWSRRRDVSLSLLALFYLIEDLVQPLVVTPPQFGQSRRQDQRGFDVLEARLDTIRSSLLRRGKSLLNSLLEVMPDAETVARAEVNLALADWQQWYGSAREARALYEEIWRTLHTEGMQELAQNWFSQPVPLPDNGAFFHPDRPPRATVPGLVKVTQFGRARAQETMVAVSLRRPATRLRRYLNATQFRPAIEDGRAVDAAPAVQQYIVYER